MPISLSCDHCGRHYKLKTKLAGTRFRCKDCSHVIHIPSLNREQTAPEPDLDLDLEEENGDEVPEETGTTPTPSLGSGLGLPPRTDSGPSSSDSSSSPSDLYQRGKNRRIPWKILTAAAIGLFLVAFLWVQFGPDSQEQEEEPQEVASQENRAADDLPEAQPKVEQEEVKPKPESRVLGKVLDNVRLQELSNNPIWKMFSFPGQPISILMPGNPQPLIHRQGGILVRGASVDFTPVFGGAYSLMFISYNIAPGQAFDIDENFDGTKQGMLKQIPSGRLTNERNISITDEGGNVHPGREFQIESEFAGQEKLMIYRMFMVGTKLIITFAGVTQKNELEFQPKAAIFLDSLTITATIPPITSTPGSEKPPAQPPPAN